MIAWANGEDHEAGPRGRLWWRYGVAAAQPAHSPSQQRSDAGRLGPTQSACRRSWRDRPTAARERQIRKMVPPMTFVWN